MGLISQRHWSQESFFFSENQEEELKKKFRGEDSMWENITQSMTQLFSYGEERIDDPGPGLL